MAQFTVRVELHEAQWTDYNTLHAAMERLGFSRLIKGDDGHTYQLPWAEYDGAANLSSLQVLALAQTAANTTGKKNSVLVTEAKYRAWSGLSLARN
ncbi:MAG TPA: type V toxin-antitoxin system endoribonuclease antitoxin GhoS [Candidatus Binataceae bacterium]